MSSIRTLLLLGLAVVAVGALVALVAMYAMTEFLPRVVPIVVPVLFLFWIMRKMWA